MFWITPEIFFGCARAMPGERFDAAKANPLLASPVRAASIVALSTGRSVRLAISCSRFLGSDDNSPTTNAPRLLELREQPAHFQPNAQVIAESVPTREIRNGYCNPFRKRRIDRLTDRRIVDICRFLGHTAQTARYSDTYASCRTTPKALFRIHY